MGTFHRYRTAWSRLHRSSGFGVHSPFAYKFITCVLRERLPYYAYAELRTLRRGVIAATSHLWRHPRIISYKNAKMLFRIVNYFNPRHILQLGTSYGVSSACMLSVSRQSHITLYEPHLERYPVVGQVLTPLMDRIACYDDLALTIHDYRAALAPDEHPFVLINDLPHGNDDYQNAWQLVQSVLHAQGVIVLRNLSRNDLMKQLWLNAKAEATYGQIFTNEKLAVVIANPKLQREDFLLWF